MTHDPKAGNKFCQFGTCLIRCDKETNSLYFEGYFDIKDLAHWLDSPRLVRFGGEFDSAWTVAQHSVYVSRVMHKFLGPRAALHGLLHDASEAFLGDICGPIKALCGEPLRAVEEQLQDAIYRMLHVPEELRPSKADSSVVKYYDQQSLIFEVKQFSPTALAPAWNKWLEAQTVDKGTQDLFFDEVMCDDIYGHALFIRQFELLRKELLT